ncbi:hypothetical protein EZ449_17405 [Pedobacter frigidisoli]|uniref:Uncharacterized protein n=1 Tax=Pedobacter frigidisoli TaxID=2530455 RepID=A0A4R0NZ79_9SPHI|nr:hypothetical protein [Pedobacter frigidisoli]TCD04414.1 hypothetical protein EZ449_17405 [Pedobacter frigidisoli]
MNSNSPAFIHYHTIAKQWASDIDFFKVEMVFLHHLLDDHFILLSSAEYIDDLKAVGKKFLTLEKDKYNVDTELIDYIKVLEGQTENLVDSHGELLDNKQKQMEQRMSHLTSTYRKLKQELFSLVISLIQDRKRQGLPQL